MRLKIILTLIIILTLAKGQNFPDKMPEIIIKYLGKERIEEYQKEAPDKLQLWLFGVYESYEVKGLTQEQEIAFRDTFDLKRYENLRKEDIDIQLSINNDVTVVLYSYDKIRSLIEQDYPYLLDAYLGLKRLPHYGEKTTKIIKR